MKSALLALLGLLFASGLQAQTANDCITQYEDLKSQFEATAPDAEVTCAKKGNHINLEREGAFHSSCLGMGKWDHWHLEAKAIGGKNGMCKMMLRGQKGVTGCGTEEIVMQLPANEQAIWRKYLENECDGKPRNEK